MSSTWDRILWGIEFSDNSSDQPMIIGAAWDETVGNKQLYRGEPSRALLFPSRKLAREWCKNKNNIFQTGTYPKDWHVKPVKVREVVFKI